MDSRSIGVFDSGLGGLTAVRQLRQLMPGKQFRRLLDLVYIGNWVLNSTRGDDRIRDYDQVESLVFSYCLDHGMAPLVELYNGEIIPSRAFAGEASRHSRSTLM